jgi:hypothetical protein
MNRTTALQESAPRTLGALVRVTPCRKLYLAGRVRIHHGLVGEAVVLSAAFPVSIAARAALIAVGAVLVWDDRHDWPFPTRDRLGPD